jgi:hypothetical protein
VQTVASVRGCEFDLDFLLSKRESISVSLGFMIRLHRGPLECGLGAVDKPAVMINWECVVRHSVIGLDGSTLEGRLEAVGKITVTNTDWGCVRP